MKMWKRTLQLNYNKFWFEIDWERKGYAADKISNIKVSTNRWMEYEKMYVCKYVATHQQIIQVKEVLVHYRMSIQLNK